MIPTLNIFDNKYKNKVIHFSGIGGVSMSGLATILHKSGYIIQGSDINPGKNLKDLIKAGVKIFDKQISSNLESADIFIRSLAIKEDNEEYVTAVKKNIPIISRHELLGEILKNFKYSVAVSGTHGKTTTSSLIGYILRLSKLDPSINIGSDLFFEKHGTHISQSEYFVLEACEYGNSFHYFKPYIGVVLNVEADHLDFFENLGDVKKGFKGFIDGIKNDGFAVYFSGDNNTGDIFSDYMKKTVSFGYLSNDDYMVNSIISEGNDTTFNVYKRGCFFGNFKLPIPGEHNVINALCAIAVCDLLHADIHFIKKGLLTFKGVDRRLEYLGVTKEGYYVYDDYAHHPTEVKASLKTLKELKREQLICVFQPHTYTRTKALFDDFVEAFENCDTLIVTDIYSAREKDKYGISSKELCLKINHPHAIYIEKLEKAEAYIKEIAHPGDLIVSMGAGDIFKISYSIIGRSIPHST